MAPVSDPQSDPAIPRHYEQPLSCSWGRHHSFTVLREAHHVFSGEIKLLGDADRSLVTFSHCRNYQIAGSAGGRATAGRLLRMRLTTLLRPRLRGMHKSQVRAVTAVHMDNLHPQRWSLHGPHCISEKQPDLMQKAGLATSALAWEHPSVAQSVCYYSRRGSRAGNRCNARDIHFDNALSVPLAAGHCSARWR